MKPKRIVLKEEFFEITGDTIEAMILNYLFEETQKEENKDGLVISIPKLTNKMLFNISWSTVRSRLISLSKKEFITVNDVFKTKNDKRMSYKTNNEIIDREMMRRGYRLFGYK